MATTVRKPLQGVTNIVKFNWHFYAFSIITLTVIFVADHFVCKQMNILTIIITSFIIFSIVVSLIVSFYVYDWSNLYQLSWLNKLDILANNQLVNIHAGFDETSQLLASKFPNVQLQVFDFYNPKLHTEISIKRARNAYPAYPNTISISTSFLPLEASSVDCIFLFFAAHEIRDDTERIYFFKQLQQSLKPSGKIVVTEHLRDIPNFMAYNIGYLHFLPQSCWIHTFQHADLQIISSQKINPFVTIFILQRNGTTS